MLGLGPLPGCAGPAPLLHWACAHCLHHAGLRPAPTARAMLGLCLLPPHVSFAAGQAEHQDTWCRTMLLSKEHQRGREQRLQTTLPPCTDWGGHVPPLGSLVPCLWRSHQTATVSCSNPARAPFSMNGALAEPDWARQWGSQSPVAPPWAQCRGAKGRGAMCPTSPGSPVGCTVVGAAPPHASGGAARV